MFPIPTTFLCPISYNTHSCLNNNNNNNPSTTPISTVSSKLEEDKSSNTIPIPCPSSHRKTMTKRIRATTRVALLPSSSFVLNPLVFITIVLSWRTLFTLASSMSQVLPLRTKDIDPTQPRCQTIARRPSVSEEAESSSRRREDSLLYVTHSMVGIAQHADSSSFDSVRQVPNGVTDAYVDNARTHAGMRMRSGRSRMSPGTHYMCIEEDGRMRIGKDGACSGERM